MKSFAEILAGAQKEGEVLIETIKRHIWDNQDARLKKLPTFCTYTRHLPDDPFICLASREHELTIISESTHGQLTYLKLTAGAAGLLAIVNYTKNPGGIVEEGQPLPEGPITAAELYSLLDTFCDRWEDHFKKSGGKRHPL